MNTFRHKLPLAALVLTVGVLSCKREQRLFHVEPSAAETVQTVKLSAIEPGPTWQNIATNYGPTNTLAANLAPEKTTGSNRLYAPGAFNNPNVKNVYAENAWAMAQGKRLYIWFNCNGCHGHGGGGMGPALMDETWIYGHELEEIFATIVQGRPNGMPSFKDRIPEYMVWQIAAYVRSISGLARKDAAPARSDHIQVKPPENTKDPEHPRPIFTNTAAEKMRE